jgi:hypothetical protein
MFAESKQLFAPVKGEKYMSAKEELIDFITNLSEEEVEKLFTRLEELTSLHEGSSPLYPLEQTLQTA